MLIRLRRGVQLLELLLSLVTASVLLTGLGSAILIANRGTQLSLQRQSASSLTQAGMLRLQSDLAEAFLITQRTAHSATLSVSDRTGDGQRDTLEYRWSGQPQTPLQMQINRSGQWLAVTEGLQDCQFSWHDSPSMAKPQVGLLEPVETLSYQSASLAAVTSGTRLSIPLPETYRPGDLLVAAVSLVGNVKSPAASAGWTVGPRRGEKNGATLAVFYTLAPVEPTLDVSWGGGRAARGIVAHFTTPAGAATLIDAQLQWGLSTNPPTPAATVTQDNALVVRLLAGGALSITEDACNLPGYLPIALRGNLLLGPSVGMAYRYESAGILSPSAFNLNLAVTYVTATLVFQP